MRATRTRAEATPRKGRAVEPVRITTAAVSPEEDRRRRQRRYMISMSIRTACFIGAVLVGEGWLRWVLVAASLILPYFAVVMANSAAPHIEGVSLPPDHDYKRELE